MNETYLDMPPIEALDLGLVLQALSDPVRLEIVSALADGEERVCGTIALRVSDSTRSHHLRILREAGVTATRIDGTKRLVSLRRNVLEERFPGLLDAVVSAAAAPV